MGGKRGAAKSRGVGYFALLGAAVLIVLLCAGCGDEGRMAGFAATADMESTTEEPPTEAEATDDRTDGEDPPSYFYFSYDDSASTAAVELAKYRLSEGVVPERSLGRPWEFLNYETFPVSDTENHDLFDLAFGVLEIEPPAAEAEATAREYKLGVSVSSPDRERTRPAVITLVVDISGSMDAQAVRTEETTYSRMDIAIHGLLTMVDTSLLDGDVVNLVTFSDDADEVFRSKTYPSDEAAIRRGIERLRPTDSTNLDAGLSLGYRVANATYDSTKTNRVILLTDAYLNTGETDVSVISENTRVGDMEKIYFAAVGISSDVHEAVLNELSEAGRGTYFSVLTKGDAGRVFSDKFVALMEVAARKVRFRLDYPPAMEHAVTASEESSVDPEEVLPTNFSYNTTQFFYEGFTATSPVETSAEFTLTIDYTLPDPAEGEDPERTITVTKTIGEILGENERAILDGELVYLLAELVGERMTIAEVDAIVAARHAGRDTPIAVEYLALIDDYRAAAAAAEGTDTTARKAPAGE